MITRVVFTSTEVKPFYRTRKLGFTPVAKGFAKSQARKNVKYMHDMFMRNYHEEEPLEISSASYQPEGEKLSAFNLKWNRKDGSCIYVENIFQSSKVFKEGGPYMDLMNKKPGSAKKDERLHNSGAMICFRFEGNDYPLKPTNAFYDWIYINALISNPDLTADLMKYNHFSDYYFNPGKSLNCQAQAAAIYVGLRKAGKLEEAMTDFDHFTKIVWEK